MDRKNEKIMYGVIILVIVAIFIGAYFLLDKLILGKDSKTTETKYKESITSQEVMNIMTQAGMSNYNSSEKINDSNQSASYIFLNVNKNYQIVYGEFNDENLAKNNFNTNLNLVKGKYSDLVEIANVDKEKYAKYEAEDTMNYVVLLRIGKSYFQVETTKNNKSSVKNIIIELEK